MSNNKTNVEREIKKLTIHSTLWAKPIEIVEFDDANLNKLSVKGKYILKYDLIDYAIKSAMVVVFGYISIT